MTHDDKARCKKCGGDLAVVNVREAQGTTLGYVVVACPTCWRAAGLELPGVTVNLGVSVATGGTTRGKKH